jgi:hypothetical protein
MINMQGEDQPLQGATRTRLMAEGPPAASISDDRQKHRAPLRSTPQARVFAARTRRNFLSLCSYGFRPKRSATQVLEAIRVAGNAGHNFVADADSYILHFSANWSAWSLNALPVIWCTKLLSCFTTLAK